MNRLVSRLFGAAALALAGWNLATSAAETRAWTDTKGKVIQAEMIRATATTVVLRMNGREYELPLERLSAADREFVQRQSASTAPPSAPAAPADAEPLKVAGVDLKPGAKTEFTVPIDPALAAETKKDTRKYDEDKDVELKSALVGLAVPADFDPVKAWPILIINVTASAKEPSSLRAMGGFVKGCTESGWLCMAVDLPDYRAPLLPLNRCALAKAALDALAAKWPASRNWPVAVGGFSGGAKYAGWVGGYLSRDGRALAGMFMAGCNEDMASKALDDFKPKRAEFTRARVFLSGGKDDRTATPAQHEAVAKSMKSSGFNEVRVEIFDGEHKLNQEHVPVALKWFMEGIVG